MNNRQWIYTYAKKYNKTLAMAIVLVLLNAVTIVIFPVLSGRIVDVVIEQQQLDQLVPILGMMIGITFFRTILRYTYQMMFERTGQNVLYDLRADLYQKMQSLDFEHFHHIKTGDMMARMTGDTDAIRHFIAWVSYNIMECVLWFSCAVVVMTKINWQLTIALLTVVPFILILALRMSKEARRIFVDIRESFSRMNGMVSENIAGNRIVKAFSREDYEIEKFNDYNEDYRQRNLDSSRVSRKYLTPLDFLASSLTGITLLIGGYFVIKKQMSLGELVTFNGFLWMLNQPMRMSGWLINDVERFNASCLKIRQLLEEETRLLQGYADSQDITGDVTFKNVSFAFADNPEKLVLKDISFHINAGQTVGLLGETGAGKSSLVNLVARFYDATAGEILLDGHPIKSYPLEKVRGNVSMVMQDIFLFSNTIEENISFGNSGLDEQELQFFAEIADANYFIEKMPEGYQTVVGERGVGLSGGQKQRISLARALAKKEASILVMDDTTSAVDLETEGKIQDQLANLEPPRTTFIISHRLSSVRQADLILVLSKGEIIESGTHQSLLAQQGIYYETFYKQIGQQEVGEDNE